MNLLFIFKEQILKGKNTLLLKLRHTTYNAWTI